MRLLLTVLFTLFVFTTSQVAVAYDRCEDADCSISMETQKQEKEQKADACSHHCAGVQAFNEVDKAAAPLTFRPMRAEWPDTQQLTSALTSTLLEPPSTL